MKSLPTYIFKSSEMIMIYTKEQHCTIIINHQYTLQLNKNVVIILNVKKQP